MPVRPRKREVVVQFRPPTPPELYVYHHSDWGAPPWDGYAHGSEWQAAHREAYGRFLRAGIDWRNEYGHLPVDPSTAPADEPWCGLFEDHDCGGVDCVHRPAAQPRLDEDDEQ